jgi:hypothetical protein
LWLEAFEKFPAALQVRSRQLAMVLSEPRQQIIVFNSHATSFVDAGDWLTTVTPASVSIHTLAPQLNGLSGL